MKLVHEVFRTVESMNPSKNANVYWEAVNRKILDFDNCISAIWQEEKRASVESIHISRGEALKVLASERERIMGFTKEQAIKEVLKMSKLENKIRFIRSVTDNGILGLGRGI